LSAQENGMAKAFFEGLLARACVLDLLDRQTWSPVLDKMGGQSALATCKSLLSAIGYREPYAGYNVMEVCFSLLASGGFRMHYDE
jgi:hypothetical protein